GFAHSANALTWRNRLGFQSADFHDVKLLVEFENVQALQSDYNSTLNGKTTYPTVLDPKVTELNRAQLVWTASATTTVTAGRQRIILDDGRFVGNVGWRQDEQTMDGVRLDTGFGRLKVTAAYLSKINRVVAQEKDWQSSSYLLNATYSVNETLRLQGFDYALDFKNAAASSTHTYGVRATGGAWVSAVKLNYIAQYATQSDYGNNPAHFTLNEQMFEASATWDIFTARVNYESFEGNGVVGFVTPLATAHAFQGFSDVFSGTGGNKTTVNGVNDLTLALTIAGHTKPWAPYILNPTLSLVYHDLDTQRLGLDIGTEWDAVFTAGLTKNLSLLLKYADFQSAGAPQPASRTKTWIMLQYKL
ncbi:MAG TPA: hypothetical protein VLZ84_07320, partial [Asticcacaulis sp.]|nr:hypothetical protein [Asticcacaulis sp.]